MQSTGMCKFRKLGDELKKNRAVQDGITFAMNFALERREYVPDLEHAPGVPL